jgi:hypothetical protein
LDWSLFYVTYSVYIKRKERAMGQQKYIVLSSLETSWSLGHSSLTNLHFVTQLFSANTTKPSTNLENHKRKPLQRKQML